MWDREVRNAPVPPLRPSDLACCVRSPRSISVVACKHTGYRWGFGMTHKSESLGILATFFDMDGRGNRCSYFRTDGATEFKSKAFIRLIEKFGIFLEKCLEYAHQTSGTVERSMQTIMADVRTSLLSSLLPHSYWLYAALWSTVSR